MLHFDVSIAPNSILTAASPQNPVGELPDPIVVRRGRDKARKKRKLRAREKIK